MNAWCWQGIVVLMLGSCAPAPHAQPAVRTTTQAAPSASATPSAPSSSASAPIAEPTPPVEWPETCPAPAINPDDDEPARLYRGFGDLYGLLLFAANKPEPAKAPSPARARAVVCATLRGSSLAIDAKTHPAAPPTCFDGQRTSFRSWRDDTVDGDFHVLGLGNSTFAVLYQPPDRTTMTPPYHYELSRQGRFVITKMQREAYWCSTDPTCYRGLPDDLSAPGYYCFDSREQCARKGFLTRLFVLDLLSERTIRFGEYNWQTDPQLVIDERELKVTTDRCSQSWPL